MSTYKIPFDKSGNLCYYPRYDTIEWRDNYEFDATLVYDGYARGRSAAVLEWRDIDTGTCYTMFLTDFDDMMRVGRVQGMRATGRWTFCKRGTNYGIRMVEARL